MNFDFSDEQKLLQSTAREFLERQSSMEVVRSVLESDEPYHRKLWTEVAEMGWLGTAVPEVYGGAGFGYLELVLLAEELGRSLAPIPFSSSVYLATEALLLFGTEAQRQQHLPSLAAGERIGTAALFADSSRDAPLRFASGRLRGTAVGVPDGDVADLAVVSARGDDSGPGLYLVDLRGLNVQARSVASLDPTRSQSVIDFDGVEAEPLEAAGSDSLEALRARAAILVAFEQLGGAQRCLEMAQAYATGRYAFGRPIASFQAPKHRLADMFVAIELSRSNNFYAAAALASGAREIPLAACVARISATDAFEWCAQENLQIHGGVGFTWEYDCHLFLRRSKLLAVALGALDGWKRRLVRQLREKRASEGRDIGLQG